ncbi:endonuclease domain-containing protein [Catellatospora tritici]|uniref:endonuclease domain-containing protein n=1 Tax=Catellatospora tritici TaxID=2851566 RepID=UPI001C2D3A9A|nr:DUF559 domain-containing protein [Catellatospora tritici]MBV1850155.1 endonuclease domain-containing protein [Catellatospora tritici]
MAQSWADLPLGRVIRLRDAALDAVELSLRPLPADAPAVLVYHPRPARTTAELVSAVLTELERAAVQLLPAWLPGAEPLDGPAGAGVAAVRALAVELAATTGHFGPFLADLAERALRGSGAGTARFAPEVRAAELAKVLAASYGRGGAAIVVEVPADLDQAAQRVLGAACEWLAAHGGFGVWLTGAPLPSAERIETVRFPLPEHLVEVVAQTPPTPAPVVPPTGVVTYPPVEGRPDPNSAAEKALEAALAKVAWAVGRIWNRRFEAYPHYIIDLQWRAERCAVEIDGPEHRGPRKFEHDRRRDVLLQLDGFAVLRFTNNQVMTELDQVLSHLERYIRNKRDDAHKE